MTRREPISVAAAARVAALGVALGAGAVSAQSPARIEAPENLPHRLPSQLVGDFHGAFGDHHARAVHTKGVIALGTFEPDAAATRLSRAEVFRSRVPIIVRFSDFTGLPGIPDTAYEASPRGLAVKFLMSDGSNLDVVAHSFDGFPVRTSAEFSSLLQALGASPAGAPKPTAFDLFLASHPTAKTFFTTQKPPPQSWGTVAYFGVNSFLFSDKAGHGRYVRYRFLPEAGEHFLKAADLKSRGPDYLREEIAARVARGPVRFGWYAQLAEPGDAVEDPSIAWPASRKLVKLGVLSIDRMDANTALADRSLLFLPGTVPPGIGIGDPMLAVRNAAYPVSFHQRQ